MASSSNSRQAVRRRRPPAVRVLPSPRPNWRDWANLDKDLTARMADHMLANSLFDYVVFRRVCAPWRETTEDPKVRSVLEPRYHPRRWILLPEPDDGEGLRCLMNIDTGSKLTLDMPELLGYHVAPGSGGAPGGVLVMVEDGSLTVRVFNPLTRQSMDLPSIAPLVSRRRRGRMDTDFLDMCKVTGAGFASESTVVLHIGMEKKLVSAKLGDESWEVISDGAQRCAVFHFAGNVYVAMMEEGLMVVDAEATPPRLVLAAPWPHKEWNAVQMAESSAGDLLVLGNKVQRRAGNDHKTMHEVFRLDSNAGMLIRVTDLGERVLFVGEYSGGLVVSTRYLDTLMPANTICFKNDQVFGKFFVRQVSDGKTTRLLSRVQDSMFLDNLIAYISWRGRKELQTD